MQLLPLYCIAMTDEFALLEKIPMKRHSGVLLSFLVLLFLLPSDVTLAASVASKWTKLRRKLDYGKSGEFDGTLAEGQKLLGEMKVLLKETKKGSSLYRQIHRAIDELSHALKKNKMMLTVDKEDKALEYTYQQATACQEKVKEIEAKAQETGRLLTPEELTTIDRQWETCIKLVKKVKTTIIRLRKSCNRLSGDYEKRWDDYEKKVDRLRDIAEQAREDLRLRRKAKR